ncbi:MAG: DUF3139 domain-containing protein [Solibacillus isronensis]
MVQMKKFFIILVILILIVFASITFIQFKKDQASDKVMQYLKEVKGYEGSEIINLESKWNFFGLPKYYVEVTFNNEPNIIYLYFAHDIKGQFEYYVIDGEKIPTEELKNYDSTTNAD